MNWANVLKTLYISTLAMPSALPGSVRGIQLLASGYRSYPRMSLLGSAVALGTGIFGTAVGLRDISPGMLVRSNSKDAALGQSTNSSGIGNFRDGGPLKEELILLSGAAVIPHPAKQDKGGEDAYFACDRGRCIGVADGVGGWAEIGVDPGLYSRELMALAKQAAETVDPSPDTPQQALQQAHKKTQARGSSTACILCLHGDKIYASNLGDSGFMLIRNGELAFMSPQQQHEFNFPYQIGSVDSMGDLPEAAQQFVVDVQEGDILVAATDGLFDNVYPDEAAALVAVTKQKGEPPASIATALAQFAHMRAADPTHLSPFAYSAQQLGYRYFGGKMDDITVVCSYIIFKQTQIESGQEQ